MFRNLKKIRSEIFKAYKKEKAWETEEYIGYNGKYIYKFGSSKEFFEYQIVNDNKIEMHRIDYNTFEDYIWTNDV